MKSDETKKVLIVASELHTRQWLSGWFQDNGYDPVVVPQFDALQGQVFENTRLVVADIEGSDSDVARLTQAVRSRSSNVPLILVASAALAGTAIWALKNGGTDFLLKPVSEAELSVKVARALNEQKLVEELASLRAATSTNQIIGGMSNGEVKTLQKIEREAIVEALDSFGGARGKTAKALGISVRTLQRKIKEYGYTKSGGTNVGEPNGGGERGPNFSPLNRTAPIHN